MGKCTSFFFFGTDGGFRPGGNLVPRVLWLFGQRVGASRDSGELEKIGIFGLAALQRLPLFYRRNLAVTKFRYPRVSTGANPLTKKPGVLWVRDWPGGRPTPFTTSYMIGRKNKKRITELYTMFPALKTVQLQVISVQ